MICGNFGENIMRIFDANPGCNADRHGPDDWCNVGGNKRPQKMRDLKPDLAAIRKNQWSRANSALACRKTGKSGSASFQSLKYRS
jgi:hypothetical protein